MMENEKKIIRWVNLSSPSAAELEAVAADFKLHPTTVEELRGPSERGRVQVFPHYFFVVLHFPIYDTVKRTSRPMEIDIIGTKDSVLTVHYENCPPIDEFRKSCEIVPGSPEQCFGTSVGEFIYRLTEHIFEFSHRELTHIEEKLIAIEEGIFGGHEKEMIREISYVKRDILDFRRVVRHISGIIESLERKAPGFNNPETRIYFEDLSGDYLRLWHAVENLHDTIESLEETNQSLLSSRIDEVTQILSVLTFLLAPFFIIGTLFQVNTRFTPILGRPYDWWILLVIMAFGCVMLYLIFKKKKWL